MTPSTGWWPTSTAAGGARCTISWGRRCACCSPGSGRGPADLYAAVGPSLGPCCAEFINFRREFPPALWDYQVRPTYFDLWRLSRDQLVAAGLLPARLDLAGLCTRCGARRFLLLPPGPGDRPPGGGHRPEGLNREAERHLPRVALSGCDWHPGVPSGGKAAGWVSHFPRQLGRVCLY